MKLKKAFQIIFSAKLNACLIFTGIMLLHLVLQFFLGAPAIALTRVWQYLFAALLLSAIQAVAFHPLVFPRLRYRARSLIFLPPALTVLLLFAYFGGWFPVEYFSAWVIFAGIFAVIYVVVSIAFGLYCRITGESYNQALDRYKQKNP